MTARASFVKIRDHLVSGLADSASLAGPTSDALPMSDGPPYRAGIEPAGGAEQHSRLIFECAPNAMLMVGSAGVIVMVNAETERIFGYSRTELLGRPVEILMPERFRAGHPDMRAAFFAHPSARPMGVGRDLYGLKKRWPGVPDRDRAQSLGAISADVTARAAQESRATPGARHWSNP
jgi:PAS domain-containing protein